jgi:hypothetical protein
LFVCHADPIPVAERAKRALYDARMGNLSPRPGRSPGTRRKREQRAFSLVVVGSTAGVVAVVGLILAIAGVVGSSVWVIAAIVAVVCALWFRSTVSR